MPSGLRMQASFAPVSAPVRQSSYTTSPPPQKKQRMAIAQTYRLAHSARGKLSSEASRGDHDLRLLVGHANLLDSLMLDLQQAEDEQEAWFNETVKGVSRSSQAPKHIQWKDTVIEQHQLEVPDDSDDDSDAADSDDEDFEDAISMTVPLRKIRSPPMPVSPIYEDEDEDEEDDEFDNSDLALVRTQSHSVSDESHLPELINDSSESDDSDDESSPPTTPPAPQLHFAELNKEQGIASHDFFTQQKPEELLQQNQTPMIAAY